jgi:hypothetical protein
MTNLIIIIRMKALKAITRILKAEKFATLGGVSDARTKIITTLVAR